MAPLRSFLLLTALFVSLCASSTTAIKVQWKKEVDTRLALPRRLGLPSRTLKAPRQATSPGLTPGALVPGTAAQGTVSAFSGPQARLRRRDASIGYFSGPRIVPLSELPHIYCANGTDYPPIEDCPLQYFEFTVPESATELIEIKQSGEYVYQNGQPLILGLQGVYIDISGWNETADEPTYFDCSLGTGSSVYVTPALINFDTTPADSPPVYFSAWTETTIWNIDPSTGVLGVNWVNTDGQFADVYLVYNPSTGNVYVTGDVTALETTLSITVEPITLVFSLGEPVVGS